MSRYGIKEVFLTIQGEGLRAGTKAVFVRFSGCNLWDGLPHHRDRGEGACAKWCDTDFFKGTVMSEEEIVEAMGMLWPVELDPNAERWCVLTGGEPCLQIDEDLMNALRFAGWKIAIETNGTEENDAASDADHICWAPKLSADGTPLPLAITVAHEVKVVLPGAAIGSPGWSMVQLLGLEKAARELWPGVALFVQPQDPLVAPNLVEETALKRKIAEPGAEVEAYLDQVFEASCAKCTAWVLANPTWRLSLQTHKFIGVP